jgi:2,3,4,5-tetrahydropyridine-2-carboxylate N-succinyltransferase
VTAEGQVLDTWYPAGFLGLGDAAADPPTLPAGLTGPRRCPACRPSRPVTVIGSLADPIKDTPDAYLRLHLLSHRLVRPNEQNLDGIFGMLANVAWTSAGPCPPDRVDELRLMERAAGRHLSVFGVDKFPRMTDYVTPSGVRIADADRVRLGAHLASGTTVMHEGFVNYNAGTLGTSMVEGRIVQGVVVGDGSDIGGGSSIMGTLSGGGTGPGQHRRAQPARRERRDRDLARRRLRGRGRRATSPARRRSRCRTAGWSRRASWPASNGLLFWRNSVTGALEARPRTGTGIELNAALHAND